MPLDPNISLAAGQGPFGPDWKTILTMQQLGQRMQMQQEELKGVNALREAYGNPQNVTPQGTLTPEATKQLYQRAPLMGMQYSQNALQMQERQARSAVNDARINEYVRSSASRMRDEALAAYDLKMSKGGMSAEAAQKGVQDEIYTPWYQQTKSSGLVGPDMMNRIPPNFDPMRARQNQQTERMAAASVPPTRAEALKEKEFELKTGEGKVETDYGRSPPVQYLRFPDNRTTDITGKNPYTPSGVGEFKGKEGDLYTGKVGDKTVTLRRGPTGGFVDDDTGAPVSGVTDPKKIGTGGGAQDKVHPAREIGVVDKDGNIVERVAANEPVTKGEPWTRAGTNEPIKVPEGGHIDVGQAAGVVMGSREAQMLQRQLGSGVQALKAIRDVVALPSTASAGWWAGRGQERGLYNAAKETLTNTVTSQDVQAYNAITPGITRSLALIDSQGLAPGQSFTDSFNKELLQEGDKIQTKMLKLARQREIIEGGMETLLTNPRIAAEQKKKAEEVLSGIKEAIPWTPIDVIALMRSNDPKATLRDVAAKQGLAPDRASPAPADRRPTTTTPSGIGIYQP